jgi:hypothetical protein
MNGGERMRLAAGAGSGAARIDVMLDELPSGERVRDASA